MARKRTQPINNIYSLQNRREQDYSAYESTVQNTVAGNRSLNQPEVLTKFLASQAPTDTSYFGPAMLNRNAISNIIGSEASVGAALESLTPYEVRRRKDPYGENEQMLDVYKALGTKNQNGVNFFDQMFAPGAGKNVSIDWQNMTGYQSHQTARQAMDAIQNAKKNGIVAWDLETTAGKIVGTENIPAHVTEFSFVKTGANGGTDTWFNSIIGATDKEYAEYNALVEKVRNYKLLTNEEFVTAHRLALAGHSRSQAEFKDGSWTYKTFAGTDDVKHLDWTVMQRGADSLYDIGKHQRANLFDVTIGGHSFKNITSYEAKLLGGIDAIVNGGATALGFNSRTFDMNRLNQLISDREKISDDVRNTIGEWFRNQTGSQFGETFTFKNHLDLMPIMREKFDKSLYTQADYAEMRKHKLTEFQQETLVRKLTGKGGLFKDSYYEQDNLVAHLAKTDVGAVVRLARETVFNNAAGLKYHYTGSELKGDVQIRGEENGVSQLFMAKQRINEGRYNLLMGMKDSLSGELRFGDKMSVDEEGNATKQLFKQVGLQRGVTYKINRLYEMDNSMREKLGELYPQMAIDKLTVMEMQAYTKNQSNTVRANSPIYYIGYKEDIEHMMQDNALYLGTVDHQGQLTSEMSDKTKSELQTFEPVHTSAGYIVQKHNTADINTIIDQGAVRAQEDAASRYTRYKDYKKDFKLLHLMQALDNAQQAGYMGGDIAKIEEEFFKNSVSVSKALLSGKKVSKDIFEHSFNAYLGYKNPKTGLEGNLFSETLSAQRARLGWMRNNRELVEYALNKAKDFGAGDVDKSTFAYQRIMQGVEDYMRGQGKLTDLGYETSQTFGFDYLNKFDVNLRGFRGIKEDKIITLNMNSYGGTMADQVIRGIDDGSVPRDYTDTGKAKILQDFQEFMYKGNILTRSNSAIVADDTLSLAGDKFKTSLLEARIANSAVGHLYDPDTGTIRGMSRIGLNTAKNLGVGDINSVKGLVDGLVKDMPTMIGVFTTDEKQIQATARNLSKEAASFLFDEADMDTLEKLNAGYTKKEMETLRDIQGRFRVDAQDYLQHLFENIGELGGQISLNREDKSVSVTANGKTIQLEMPTGEIRGGQYQTRLGRMNVSMAVGFYDMRDYNASKAEIKYGSIIKKAFSQNRTLMNWNKRQGLRNGTAIESIQRMTSGVNDMIRHSPVAKEFGEAQRRNMFLFDYWDAIQNAGQYLTEEDLREAERRHPDAKVSLEALRKLKTGDVHIDPDHPGMVELNAVLKFHDIVFERIKKVEGIDSEGVKALEKLQMDIKSSEKGFGSLTHVGDVTHDYNQQIRHPVSIEDASRLNFSKINEYIKEGENGNKEFSALKGITSGTALTQESRSKFTRFADGLVDKDGNPLEFDTKFRGRAVHMNRGGLALVANEGLNRLIVQAAASPDKLAKYNGVQDLVRSMFIDEGAAYMHGQVFDRILNVRDSTQKIALDKMIVSDGITINEMGVKSKAVPKLELKNGKFSFSYDAGMFVSQGDVIGSTAGLNGKAKTEFAKYSGILNFGLFNNENHLIEQEEITNLINNDAQLCNELMNMDSNRRAEAVMDFLEKKHKFNWNYYVGEEKANTTVKVAEYSEKGMTKALIANTGQLNKDIKSLMEQFGFQGDLSYFAKDKSLQRLSQVEALEIGMIDSLKEADFSKSKFAVSAMGRMERLGRKASADDIKRSIESKFGSVEKFRQAIMEERYSVSDVVDEIFHKVDFDGQTVLGSNENWHLITGHMQSGMAKHGDVTSYRYLMDTWVRQGIEKNNGNVQAGTAWARDNVIKYLLPSKYSQRNADDIIKIEGNRMLLSDEVANEMNHLQYSSLQQAYKDTGIVDGSGKFVGEKTLKVVRDGVTQYVQTESAGMEGSRVGHYWDREKDTSDAVRFNQRSITVAEGQRVGELGKENVRQFLKASGREDLFSKYVEGLETGDAVYSSAADQIRRNMFNRAGGGDTVAGYFKNSTGDALEWGIDEGKLRNIVKDENIFNGDVDKGTEFMKTYLTNMRDKMNISTVNREGVVEAYKAFSATAAASHLTNQTSTEELGRLGFSTKNILDLDISNHSMDSLFNQNIIVDLKTGNSAIDNALFGGDSNKRFLALSYNPVGDTERFTAAQAKIAGLQSRIRDFQERSDFGDFEGTTAERELDKLTNSLDNARDAVWNAFNSKKGVIAGAFRAHMHGATRNTAMGFDILGIEKFENKDVSLEQLFNKFGESKLSKLEINGINLVKEAREGKNAIQFGYTILSTERMHDIYDKELRGILGQFGMTDNTSAAYSNIRNELYEELQTKGTHGISAREPMQYFGSIQQRQIFFSDIAQGNEALGNFTGAQMRKEDFDSDAVMNAIHREQVSIKQGNQIINANIDSAMINVLRRRGFEVNLLDTGGEERLRNYDTSQIYVGAGSAQRYRNFIDIAQQDLEHQMKDSSVVVKSAEGLNEAEIKDLRDKYGGLMYDSLNNQFVLGKRSGVTYGEMEAFRKTYYDTRDELFKELGGEFVNADSMKRRDMMMEYAGKIAGTDANKAENIRKSVYFSLTDETLSKDLMARTAQPYGAGIVNHYTQTYLNAANEALSDSGIKDFLKETRGMQEKDISMLMDDIVHITTALQEGYLSPKNNTGEVDTSGLVNVFKKAFSLSEDASLETRQNLKNEMYNVIWGGTVSGRLNKEASHLMNEYGKVLTNEKDIEERAQKGTWNYINFLVDDISMRGNPKSVYGVAASNDQKFRTGFKVTRVENPSRIMDQGFEAMAETASAFANVNNMMALRDSATFSKNTSSLQDDSGGDIADNEQRLARAKAMQRSVSEASSHVPKGGHSKAGLLLNAAVGIAGGLMVAGFVNDPSGGAHVPQSERPIPTAEGSAFGSAPMPNTSHPEPAIDQAQSGAQYLSAMQMPLADSNLNVLRGGPKSSYVINISGSSPQGQQMAANAINSAISGPIPHNSSINVSVNNNFQDTLNQAQVNRMVQTAIGF